MKLSRLSFSLAFFFLLALVALPGRAQYVYGVTALQLDTELDHAYGYSATALDYYACYYYDAAVVGTLYEGTTAIDGDSYHGICAAEVYTDGPTQDNTFYTEVSEHYLIAYYYYYYYGGFYDPYGFFGFTSGGGYGGSFNYYGCYCPSYFAQSTQDLGSTQVTLFNPGVQDPKLDGDSSVTREDEARFWIDNFIPGDQVTWSFTDGTHVVNRSGGTTDKEWRGLMVTSGTVRATVTRGTATFHLSKPITVKPRSGFAFPAVNPIKVSNNFYCYENGTLFLPSPPANILAKVCLIQRGNFHEWQVNGGPNHEYWYVKSASPVDSTSSHPQTAIYLLIHPDLENTDSEFFRAQCGTFNEVTNPSGFISGSQLLSNAYAHEIGTIKGHYQQYIDAQNRPENNIGVGMEAAVGAPNPNKEPFLQAVRDEAIRRRDIIEAAFNSEAACNSYLRYDEQCRDHGPINFPPYVPCPPSTLPSPRSPLHLAGAASSSQINLSWTDDSGDEQGFKIERSAAGSAFAEIGSVGAGVTAYSDAAITAGTTYTYQVRSWNASGVSAPSSPVTVTALPAGSPPDSPCCLWGYAPYGMGSVTLSWSDQSNNEDGFVIERSDGWGSIFYAYAWVPANTTTFTDYGLQPGQSYSYRIVAENAWGSSYSEEFNYFEPNWWW